MGEGGGGGEGELLLVLRFSVSRPCGTPCGWEESDAVDCGAGVDDYESRAVVELDLQFLGVRLTGPPDGGNEDGVGWAAAGGGAWTGWMSETERENGFVITYVSTLFTCADIHPGRAAMCWQHCERASPLATFIQSFLRRVYMRLTLSTINYSSYS